MVGVERLRLMTAKAISGSLRMFQGKALVKGAQFLISPIGVYFPIISKRASMSARETTHMLS